MIGIQLNSKEIMTRQPDKAVLKHLDSLSCNASLNVIMELEKKIIEVRFEDSEKDFKISFAEGQDPEAAFTVITTNGAVQLLRTLRNVQTLLTASVSEMTIDLGTVDKEALDELAEIQCEKLIVKGATEIIPGDEIAEVLNKIKATEEYCIESDIGCKVLPTHLPSQKLSLKFATGITQADLLKIAGKTRIIELLGSSLTSEDLHEFVKTWFESRECTTVSLRVRKKNQETWDMQQVLLGIQYAPRQEWMRDKSFVTGRSETGFPESVKDMELAMDVDRADRVIGLIGSVLITGNELFFCVWHNRREIETKLAEYRMKFKKAEEYSFVMAQSYFRAFICFGLTNEENPHRDEWENAVLEYLQVKEAFQTLINYSQSFFDEPCSVEFF